MGGRPRILTGKRLELAQWLFNDPKNSSRDIAKTIGVSLATLYRYVRPYTGRARAAVEDRAPAGYETTKTNASPVKIVLR
jgi:hypothetical protein